LHLARHPDPHERHRPRRVRQWPSLPRLRKPPAVAPMVAQQVSSTATNPGMDAPCRELSLVSRQRAETYATTKPTMSAGTPPCLWAGDKMMLGGIAAACSPGGSWPGRSGSKCGRCAISGHGRAPRISDRRRRETYTATRATPSARRPAIFLPGDRWNTIGIAPAWRSTSKETASGIGETHLS